MSYDTPSPWQLLAGFDNLALFVPLRITVVDATNVIVGLPPVPPVGFVAAASLYLVHPVGVFPTVSDSKFPFVMKFIPAPDGPVDPVGPVGPVPEGPVGPVMPVVPVPVGPVGPVLPVDPVMLAPVGPV